MEIELHEELQRYRKEVLELSQGEAAERLNIGSSSLSNYERGIREIPSKMLPKFKEVYKIPTKEMNRILYGENTDEYNSDPMVLRESFENEETAAIIQMLDEHPKLKRVLASLTYQTDKRKEKFSNQVSQLYNFIREW
ncbi:helix-turn-helix domain-containing protein [Rossellomorea aquimaris]|uniref:helix-turn-helix domain-containing protein n=1 Tax=Rossellomorea aquimaris TaxID=189382 RepID=UPI001CD28862|nr:helix-turn-helix transcriptional regulator [Rossellomorea aquimaris]MCA1055152.1 helix-turn-helix domain-containing protein [Rossellomorea aquimaris]